MSASECDPHWVEKIFSLRSGGGLYFIHDGLECLRRYWSRERDNTRGKRFEDRARGWAREDRRIFFVSQGCHRVDGKTRLLR